MEICHLLKEKERLTVINEHLEIEAQELDVDNERAEVRLMSKVRHDDERLRLLRDLDVRQRVMIDTRFSLQRSPN